MGLISIPTLLLTQAVAGKGDRASATASILFSRNLGSTLGAALVGALFNLGLLRAEGGISSEQLRRLVELQAAPQGPSDAAASALIGTVLHDSFAGMFVLGIATAALALWMPRVLPADLVAMAERSAPDGAGEAESS